ncbi:MAG TPA: twin-arginine translocase TatA/TatE family subunit [Anaerolineales bacterium]|nr:twin-arginine translocase TatA/TatE family subunit [Anaerolineales bacterium]
MEILGVGWQELIFIFLIALIVLGPKDMQKAGKTIGRWLNQLVRSEGWKALQQTSRELRKLPTTLMREANLEELQETKQAIREGLDINPKRSTSYMDLRRAPSNEPENTIQPPSVNTNAQAAVPGGESSAAPFEDAGAKDSAESKNSGNELERHD